jgi:hypothetical protein
MTTPVPFQNRVHAESVRAMLHDPVVQMLLYSLSPRKLLGEIENPPDWVVAGANCHTDEEAVVEALTVFLNDWRGEK